MIIGLIVLGLLLCASIAFNFFLWKILKNTYKILIDNEQKNNIDELAELRAALNNFDNNIAYDGEYYPGHLFLSIEPNTEDDALVQIMDFSFYEKYKIIGCTIKYNQASEDDYGTHMIPKVVVFQPMEGVWTWKY